MLDSVPSLLPFWTKRFDEIVLDAELAATRKIKRQKKVKIISKDKVKYVKKCNFCELPSETAVSLEGHETIS